MLKNRIIRDRAMRRMDREMQRSGRVNPHYDQVRDSRNPYGSRGGYVDSRSYGNDMRMPMDSRDYATGYRNNEPRTYSGERTGHDYHYGPERYGQHSGPMYEMYGVGGIRPRQDYYPSNDYNDYNDYNRGGQDYRGYDRKYDMNERDYAMEEESYKKDLKEWISKLKKKETRFGWNQDQVIQSAKSMGVKFDDFSEEEFYAIYLALVTDHPKASTEPRMYLNMAKEWMHNDDTAVKGSEKVCAYLYSIVLGEEE